MKCAQKHNVYGPESSTPIITSSPFEALTWDSENPMKSHDLVVWSCNGVLGRIETTSSISVQICSIKSNGLTSNLYYMKSLLSMRFQRQ